MGSYDDLEVYKRSYTSAIEIHKLTQAKTQDDLVRQIRRASKSIPANIAEGLSNGNSPAEVMRFLSIALRSCDEVKVWLDFSRDLEYIAAEDSDRLKSEYSQYGAMLYKLRKRYADRVE